MGPTQAGGRSTLGLQGWIRWAWLPTLFALWVGACGRAPLGENPIQLAECGDALCSPSEDGDTCAEDCFCGDGVCTDGETNTTCSADCERECGDDICDEGETAATCRVDCGS